MNKKICSKCKKPVERKFFSPDKRTSDRLASQCKICRSSYRNPEKQAIRSKRWYNKNFEARKAYSSKYQKANKERHAIREHLRRAKLKGNGGTFTPEQWKTMKQEYNYTCVSCYKTTTMTMDHIVPISLGGENSIGNIQPMCKPCNSSKGATTKNYKFWFMVA